MTKRGVTWRVYESYPSVTMLRMFSRYVGNNEDIRRLEDFEADARAGNLPAFSYVEPAMHHHPQDDDHPPADMWRGQTFIRRVYEALRASEKWERTLLIITYDEHGGLYDHVVPPLADVVADTLQSGEAGPVIGTPGGTSTGSGAGFGALAGQHVRAGDVAGRATLETAGNVRTPGAPMTLIHYGVRVPTFVVSPWTTPGRGPSIVLDHCSILKTVLARFVGDDLGAFLSDRVAASYSFESYLSAPTPRLDVPQPPPVDELPIDVRRSVSQSKIITPALSRKRMRANDVDYRDLSGFVARMIGR